MSERSNPSRRTIMSGAAAYVAEFEASGWADANAIHRNLANALQRLTTSAVVS